MSFEATAWAIQQKPKTAHEKLVLMLISDCYNKQTTRCDPSIPYLAEVGICSERTVMRTISSLEKQGYLKTKKEEGKRTNYELIFDKKNENPCQRVTPDRESPLTESHPTPDRESPVPLTESHPTPDRESPEPGSNQEVNQEPTRKVSASTEKPKPQKSKTKPKTKTADLDFSSWPRLASDQIWTDYKKLRQAKRAPISQTVINSMGRELTALATQGITVDQAIEVCITKGWQGLKADWVINHLKTIDWVSPTGGNHATHQRRPEKLPPAERIRRQAEQHLRELDERERLERENGALGCSAMDPNVSAVSAQMEFIRGRIENGKWPDE